jgi:GH18 family chitinase
MTYLVTEIVKRAISPGLAVIGIMTYGRGVAGRAISQLTDSLTENCDTDTKLSRP